MTTLVCFQKPKQFYHLSNLPSVISCGRNNFDFFSLLPLLLCGSSSDISKSEIINLIIHYFLFITYFDIYYLLFFRHNIVGNIFPYIMFCLFLAVFKNGQVWELLPWSKMSPNFLYPQNQHEALINFHNFNIVPRF